jgi:hypothetical protein
MTTDELQTLLKDWSRLCEAVNDPSMLPLLPQRTETLDALPGHLKPFQARWIFGNCSDEVLAILRESRPEIVAMRLTGQSYRYSKAECCRAAKLNGEGP